MKQTFKNQWHLSIFKTIPKYKSKQDISIFEIFKSKYKYIFSEFLDSLNINENTHI
jgi:hypothetical protein